VSSGEAHDTDLEPLAGRERRERVNALLHRGGIVGPPMPEIEEEFRRAPGGGAAYKRELEEEAARNEREAEDAQGKRQAYDAFETCMKQKDGHCSGFLERCDLKSLEERWLRTGIPGRRTPSEFNSRNCGVPLLRHRKRVGGQHAA
jgi:hypothetical protein